MDKSSLLYWFPIIKDLPIPMPKTSWVEIPFDIFCRYMDFNFDEKPNIADYTEQIKLKGKEIGYPLFLRTDLASGKHDWDKSCYVENEEDLFFHIWNVVEFNFIADIIGLRCEALVFREYIPMASKFTAFWGNLPISPERRYFIRDGVVECHHPYWTEDAINKSGFIPSVKNWSLLLRQMNMETKREVELLTGYVMRVAELLQGYWSVDFSKSKEGKWILIDMADGDSSYHQECPMKK